MATTSGILDFLETDTFRKYISRPFGDRVFKTEITCEIQLAATKLCNIHAVNIITSARKSVALSPVTFENETADFDSALA